MNYTALIMDIVNSRQMTEKNRYKLQLFIKSVITYLNKVFDKAIKSKVEISSGDSMQGLFNDPCSAFLYFRQLELLLYPIEVRGGIGEGRIYYDEDWKSSELEGPAYYNARKAIDLSKEKNITNLSYISFSKIDKYINTMLVASKSYDKKNSITINLIKLMAELYYPLYKNDSMDFIEYSVYQELFDILNFKEEFYNIIINLDEDSSIKGAYPDASNYIIPKLADCEMVDLELLYQTNKSDIIDCFWKRGFSKKISISMNNTSRQNVDKHLDGGIIDQRNLDGAICLLLIEKKGELLK